MSNEKPLVSIVIPTHNRREMLARLIRSLLESNYPKDRLEIIVVDDASTDGTHEYIKMLFPQVKVIRNNEENLLAESRNIGIRTSMGKYIFLIDDDNIVDKNTIKELVEFMEDHPDVGVAGPIMYFLKDPTRIWCAGIKRNYWITITKYVGSNTRDKGQYREFHESDDFPNAFMVRREVFEKVGLFNSRLFPIHYDEGDFCQRVRKAGYKVMVVPTARVWHDIPLPEENKVWLSRLKNPPRAYYTIRNRILFHAMWSKSTMQMFTALMASLVITFYYAIVVLKEVTDHRSEVLKAIIRGVIDGLRLMRG
ncbi:MAG: glycosyltransferase family 2 protein [Staphylothermus sp.]|nr:glycosyltransferase family 2 protein [Staphylothermus sp.]